MKGIEQYKSRGRRADNGEWVKGYVYMFPQICRIRHWIESMNTYGDVDVDPETVGRCTGVKDKNDVWIFEGDIVKKIVDYSNGRSSRKVEWVGKVDYGRAQYHVSWYIGHRGYHALNDFIVNGKIQVIGNIHDNPELLEEK